MFLKKFAIGEKNRKRRQRGSVSQKPQRCCHFRSRKGGKNWKHDVALLSQPHLAEKGRQHKNATNEVSKICQTPHQCGTLPSPPFASGAPQRAGLRIINITITIQKHFVPPNPYSSCCIPHNLLFMRTIKPTDVFKPGSNWFIVLKIAHCETI